MEMQTPQMTVPTLVSPQHPADLIRTLVEEAKRERPAPALIDRATWQEIQKQALAANEDFMRFEQRRERAAAALRQRMFELQKVVAALADLRADLRQAVVAAVEIVELLPELTGYVDALPPYLATADDLADSIVAIEAAEHEVLGMLEGTAGRTGRKPEPGEMTR
jgi:hypothetical protein